MTPSPTPSAREFLRGLVARSVGLLATVAALNLLVDPFGIYGTGGFEPIVVNSRGPKLALYRQQAPAPEIVIMGSSRSLTLDPAYVKAMTSRPTFNAAVHGGGTRDYLNLARCLAVSGAFPPVLLVGLGVEQMLGPGGLVEHGDPFASCVKADRLTPAEALRNYRSALTLQETWSSLRLLGLEATGRPAPLFTFAPDGGIVFRSPHAPSSQALDEALAGNWAPATFDAPALGGPNLAAMTQLLELARERHATVIVYLPPYHPRALARYIRESRFVPLREALLQQLDAWARQYPLKFHDFSDPSAFGGRAEMFFDAAHPRDEAYRLMVDAMRADLS